MKAMLLAAGEGVRLRPLTLHQPKVMLPIAGQPLLEITIRWLKKYGVNQVAINLHHRPEAITSYFGDGRPWGVEISYSYEEKLLGTAGAVRKLRDLFQETFVLVYGDVLTDLPLEALRRFHRAKGSGHPSAYLTMALYHVPNPTEVGLVSLDEEGRVLAFKEKPCPEEVFTDLANSGILILEPEIIEYIPEDTFYDFGHHLFPKLLEEGVPMYGWPIPADTYLLDIGTPEKYRKAQREWPLRHP
ncbi:MAG TPA: NDP-sugar synthase [Anaerolineae bacterium]|nr:NDP-sugar synthase [Anaerolineae bacterium]